MLKDVTDTILFAFGVIYTWVSLANPGTQLGAGLGGLIGAVGFALGPAAGASTVAAGATVGGILGGLFGSGVYKWSDERSNGRERMAAEARADGDMQHQPLYNFEGNEWGGLLMYLAARDAWRHDLAKCSSKQP